MTKERWEDFEREDLNCIPKMEALGFDTKFHCMDAWNGRVTPGNVPHEAAYFTKDDLVVWACKGGWVGARLEQRGQCFYHVGHVKAGTPMEATTELESSICANA